MYRIEIPKDMDGYKEGEKLWNKLELTGRMRIEKGKESWIISLWPEKEIKISAIKKVVPKCAKVEEVNEKMREAGEREGSEGEI
ncbi:hypothetical protein SAMN02746089_02709 [Caldanaerobius fijiensis DSM 17918]|uniref:Uncharacterized protein n=1 Tax=Caldanaerobius fijiensis DSM 17918 TaxID=1121256 RepID=A0A1M5F928_9THEO|nr:hypothetical protein [Caldanaerobius fijiensis]SHF87986.1 hypothetical protein SAMN02746089_02709 [Caldanaerobius fijiensis DSM 17918]